jgi:hypothetical protein
MNDKLDRLLHADARERLADDGFTARLMEALPARPAHRMAWLKPVLVLGSAALGSALAVAFAPAGTSLYQGFVDLVQLRAFTPAALTGAAMSAALLISAIVLAADETGA